MLLKKPAMDIDFTQAVTVLNRKDRPEGIYIGRGGRGQKGSALANPYKMGDESDRERVIEQFRGWLWEQVQAREGAAWEELVRLAAKLKAGEKLSLVCWCAPKHCHGDVIKAYLAWMLHTGLV